MNGYGATRDVESSRSGDSTYRKIEIEEADGGSSSSGQKEHDLSVFVHESIWP